MSASTSTPRRRSLLGHLAGATVVTVIVRSCTTLGEAPGLCGGLLEVHGYATRAVMHASMGERLTG